MRRRSYRGHALVAGICWAVLVAPGLAGGQGAEVAGMVSEIKVGGGRVEVRPGGSSAWRPAAPLLALRPGDTVRATQNASAVIVMRGGGGIVRVDRTNSPFVVPAPAAGEGGLQKARALLEASFSFLSGGAAEVPRAGLSTRGGPRPPVVLTPRNGPVLPGPLTFEWLGSRFARYTLRIVGPSGVLLERTGISGDRFTYPPDAPPLTPGIRYTFQVLADRHPPQEVWLEVMDAGRGEVIRRELGELEQALGPGASASTLAALRAGFLASNGLLHDARLTVLAALAGDPDEPTLHLLLGTLYSKTGLPDQAAEARAEAQFLMTRSGTEPPPATGR